MSEITLYTINAIIDISPMDIIPIFRFIFIINNIPPSNKVNNIYIIIFLFINSIFFNYERCNASDKCAKMAIISFPKTNNNIIIGNII